MELKNKLNLEVSISQGNGFCSGVLKAIQLAEEMLDRGEEVYCVGKIVHNDLEVKRLENKGLHIISLNDLSSLHHKNILFRAHGEPPSSYKLATQNGNKLIDASCKVVLKIQDTIKRSVENCENVVIYGKKDHPEVLGLMGQGNEKFLVVEDQKEAEKLNFPAKISLYSQTTKSLEGFYSLAEHLENRGIKVEMHDTVCRQVHKREAKLLEFAAEQDVIIFVAGKESSNGKVLYNLCQSVNSSSYYISSAEDIDISWFKPNQYVGLAGATSTPLWLLEEVKYALLEL